jgi:hypothetical protein
MAKKTISIVDVQKAIDDAIAMCHEQGLEPENSFVHIAVMMDATEIKVYLNGETVWIGGNNYLLPEEFELE